MNKLMLISLLFPTMLFAKVSVDVDIDLTLCNVENVGQTSFEVIEGELKEFSFGNFMYCKMILSKLEQDKIKVDFEISDEQGNVVSSPCMVVKQDEKAILEIREEDESDFLRLSFVAKNIES